MSSHTMPGLAAALAGLALAACGPGGVLGRGPAGPLSDEVRDLPLVEVPAAEGDALAVLLTGDGGWATLDRRVAAGLAGHGVAVVGLRSCAYLARHRSADDLGRDVARVLRHYGRAWRRDRVVLVGYSRGADLVPFAANRLPPDLRSRLALVAMLGPADAAGFTCHWSDLLRETSRPADLPLRPELERLRDVATLCVYGIGERESACRDAAPPEMQRVAHAGGHHFDGDGAGLAVAILGRLATSHGAQGDTTPPIPPAMSDVTFARTRGSTRPPGDARYFGVQTGRNFSLYWRRPRKL